MKIRTIDAGYKEYKETIDPNTSVSKYSWRQIVINRKLKSVRQSGNRWLYDLDEMTKYLCCPLPENEVIPSEIMTLGKIRKIQA